MDALSQTEKELCELALGGDVQALAALVERCRPSLYATAIGLLGNRADALDAVQDTAVVALLRITDLRDPTAARAWLHTVLRNVCRQRLRQRREIPQVEIELPDVMPGPEQALEDHVMREWVWQALESLSPEEQLTVMLRHFTRCSSYEAIARVTAVPIGTVRSRLHRARSRLASALLDTVSGTPFSHADLQAAQQDQWMQFYRLLHQQPAPRTYEDLFAADVEVRDPAGQWHGIQAWSAEEREAISLGVQARVLAVMASGGLTVVELDFLNPPEWPGHCPPQATFVHRIVDGQSRQVRIHYPDPVGTPSAAPHEQAAALVG